MRTSFRSCLTVLGVFLGGLAQAAGDTQGKNEAFFQKPDVHPYSELFSVQVGAFRPANLTVSNSHSQFQYAGDSLKSFVVEPGCGIKLFHLLGAVYLEENLPISSFKGSLPGGAGGLSLLTMGIDTRIRHSWEWFPLKAFIPFIEGGYLATFYSQSGPSDFESAQGLAGNFVAGAGFDIWLNAMFSRPHNNVDRYDSMPVFLTGKVNRILSNGSRFDMGSTSYLAGLSIGI